MSEVQPSVCHQEGAEFPPFCSTRRAALFPSHLRQDSLLLVRGGLLARSRISSPLSAFRAASISLEWEGDRVRRKNATPSTFLHGFALRTGRAYQLHWCALQHAVRTVSELTCSAPNSFVEASCAGTLPTRTRKENRVALERLSASGLFLIASW